MKKSCGCKHLLVTLTAAALITFLIVLLNDAVIIVYLEHQNHQLKESDSSVEQNAQVGDASLQITLMQELKNLQSNFTAELQAMRQALNATEQRLVEAKVTIVTLEKKHIATFQTMEELLNATEGRLLAATDKIAVLEDNHSAALRKMEAALNATNKQLTSATTKINNLESELTTKASVVVVRDLQENLTSLAVASSIEDDEIRREIQDLTDNSLNQTQLQDIIAMFANTKTNQSDFEELVSHVTTLQNSTDTLSQTVENTTTEFTTKIEDLSITVYSTTVALASKADQLELNSLSHQVEELGATTVERSEFDSLSANLTSLSETTSMIDQGLRADVDDLADGINRTYHTQLQDMVNMLAKNKANQSEFETLKQQLSTLSQDTRDSISQLTGNVTTLGRSVQSVNDNLTSKAERQDLTKLTNHVDTLGTGLETLNDTVDGLKTSKAEKSEFEDIQNESNGLDGRLTQHISSSEEMHDQLAADISDNKNQIDANTNEITDAESSISQLQTQVAASSFGPTASWKNTVISVSLTFGTILMTIHFT